MDICGKKFHKIKEKTKNIRIVCVGGGRKKKKKEKIL